MVTVVLARFTAIQQCLPKARYAGTQAPEARLQEFHVNLCAYYIRIYFSVAFLVIGYVTRQNKPTDLREIVATVVGNILIVH